jgi:hypothetical protein
MSSSCWIVFYEGRLYCDVKHSDSAESKKKVFDET